MSYVDWMIKGKKLAACNCNYGCPCEFNAPPTHDVCEGLEAMEIDEGYFGDVRLDGIKFAATYRWPGPVHEGGGIAQGIIDESASEAQVEALFQILEGKEQEPTTVFNIIGSTIEKELDPVFADLEFECDFATRSGRFAVPGQMELTLEPIKNPVTGAVHPAQIVPPTGFEFLTAEVASGSFKASGELGMERSGVYAFLTQVAYGPNGLIEEKSYRG